MPKSSKIITAELEDFLSAFSPELRNIALQLRELVLEMAPDAIEQIDTSAHLLGYGYAKTYAHLICVIILYGDYVNLGFPRGVDLDDPEGLLEGTGKKARHVKIRSEEQIDSPDLLQLLQESIDITPRPGGEG